LNRNSQYQIPWNSGDSEVVTCWQGADGCICLQKQIVTFIQLFVGNMSHGREETIWPHERSNRHTKINVAFCICYLILQWLSNQYCEERICGKDAYTVLVTEIWYWMTQEKDEKY
jgi:hypothetical protein